MKQQSGDESNNIQIGENVTIGVSYQEARQIALDVFKANFYEFSEKASKKAIERAEEITEDFVKDFFNKIPHLAYKLEEPSIQSSMFNAQKEYAKSGDKELEKRLLELLIERINSEERSLKRIVLDEALLILPKLTNEQVNILTLIFSAINLNHHAVNNIPSLIDFINNKLMKFFPENISNYSFFTHLQFSGCCIVLPEGAKYKPLEEIYKHRFKGLFSKGFSEQEFKNEVDEDLNKYKSLFIRCLQNPIALQINAMSDEVVNQKIVELNIGEAGDKIKNLWNRVTMTEDEIKRYIVNINPKANKLLDDWKEKDYKTIQLTSVGYAIAIMNYNKVTGENISIDEFI